MTGVDLHHYFFYLSSSQSSVLARASAGSLPRRVGIILDLDINQLALVCVRDCVLHTGQRLCNLAEKRLYVVAGLCTGLDKHDVELLGLLLSFFCSHLALLVKIGLVANQDNNHICATFRTDIVDPLGCVQERVTVY